MNSVLYLEANDDIATIKTRLSSVSGSPVVLVAPKGLKALHDRVDLRLLRRYLDFSRQELLLVIPDSRGRAIAEHEGFLAFSSLKELGYQEGAPTAGLMERLRLSLERGRRRAHWSWGVGLAVVALTFFSGVGYLWVPSASIKVMPASEQVSRTLSITANLQQAAIEPISGQIPARALEVMMQGSGGISTTGKKQVPNEYARGEVTLINKSSEQVLVPRGTRVGTDKGVQFRTMEDVLLPAQPNSSAKVAIEAMEPGSQANVDKLTIDQIYSGALSFRVGVFNEAPTSGGTEKETGLVTVQDQEKLRQKVIDKIKEDGLRSLMASKRSSESIYPESLRVKILEENLEQRLGDTSPWLNMTARASVTALAFEGKDVITLAGQMLLSGRKEGEQLLSGSLNLRPLEAYAWDENKISFRVAAQGLIGQNMDPQKLSWELAGLSVEETRNHLKKTYVLVKEPEVRLSPAWMSSLPRLPWRISVRVAPEG